MTFPKIGDQKWSKSLLRRPWSPKGDLIGNPVDLFALVTKSVRKNLSKHLKLHFMSKQYGDVCFLWMMTIILLSQ